jgi:hypothetical protein
VFIFVASCAVHAIQYEKKVNDYLSGSKYDERELMPRSPKEIDHVVKCFISMDPEDYGQMGRIELIIAEAPIRTKMEFIRGVLSDSSDARHRRLVIGMLLRYVGRAEDTQTLQYVNWVGILDRQFESEADAGTFFEYLMVYRALGLSESVRKHIEKVIAEAEGDSRMRSVAKDFAEMHGWK